MPVATAMTIVDAAIITATDDRPGNGAAINTTTSNPAIDASARDAATMETAATAATKTTAATTTAAYGLRNRLGRSVCPTVRY